MEVAPIVMKDPKNYDARANIMWAGTLAHNGICGCGKVEDWASHGMEHELSALYGVAHGAGLSVILLAYMRYMLEHKPERVVKLSRNVLGVTENDDLKAGAKGIEKLGEFFKSIGMPVTLSQLGIENPDIPLLVKKVHQNKGETFGAYFPITSEVSTAIYTLALGK